MSDENYKHTYQDFLDFCKAAEEHNQEAFEKSKLIKQTDRTMQYIGTYRDAENFKKPFYVTFNEEAGSISYVAGPDECMNELDTLYLEMFRSKVFPEMDVPADKSAFEQAGMQTMSPVSKDHPNAALLTQITESVQTNLTMVLSGAEKSENLLHQSQKLLTQGINLLGGINPAVEPSEVTSDFVTHGMKTICNIIAGLATPGESFFVTQGRKIFQRDDVSGWDSDFETDESALVALRNSTLVFEAPFDRTQCSEIEADLQNGEAFIVQRDLQDAFGYNTLIRSSEGSYSLISLGGTN